MKSGRSVEHMGLKVQTQAGFTQIVLVYKVCKRQNFACPVCTGGGASTEDVFHKQMIVVEHLKSVAKELKNESER